MTSSATTETIKIVLVCSRKTDTYSISSLHFIIAIFFSIVRYLLTPSNDLGNTKTRRGFLPGPRWCSIGPVCRPRRGGAGVDRRLGHRDIFTIGNRRATVFNKFLSILGRKFSFNLREGTKKDSFISNSVSSSVNGKGKYDRFMRPGSFIVRITISILR